MRPCVSSFSLQLFLLLLVPLAVSPRPLPPPDNAHDVLAKRAMPRVPVSAEIQSGPASLSSAPTTTPTTATPELSAIHSPDSGNLPSLLQLRATSPFVNKARLEARSHYRRGTPITTFEDGLVLEVSSGVATNLPSATPLAATTTNNTPNLPPQDTKVQTQAVQSSSRPQMTAEAQAGNGNMNTVTTLPGSTGPSTTAPAILPAALSTNAASTTLPSRYAFAFCVLSVLLNINLSSLNINGGTKSATGGERSAVSHPTVTLTSAGATWVVQPFVSVFTTVDGDGRVYTTSGIFSSTSKLAPASTEEQVDHSQSPTPGAGDESESGDNPP